MDAELMQQQLYSNKDETTNIDKILAKSEVERLRQLVKKDFLERNELLEIVYALSAIETKLVHLTPNDRYLIGKLLVWVREFCVLAERQYDVIQHILSRLPEQLRTSKKLKELSIEFNKVTLKDELSKLEKSKGITKKHLRDIIQKHEIAMKTMRLVQHDYKFMVDIYLYLTRSTLSLQGTAFEALTKQRLEYLTPPSDYAVAKKKGFLGFGKGG